MNFKYSFVTFLFLALPLSAHAQTPYAIAQNALCESPVHLDVFYGAIKDSGFQYDQTNTSWGLLKCLPWVGVENQVPVFEALEQTPNFELSQAPLLFQYSKFLSDDALAEIFAHPQFDGKSNIEIDQCIGGDGRRFGFMNFISFMNENISNQRNLEQFQRILRLARPYSEKFDLNQEISSCSSIRRETLLGVLTQSYFSTETPANQKAQVRADMEAIGNFPGYVAYSEIDRSQQPPVYKGFLDGLVIYNYVTLGLLAPGRYEDLLFFIHLFHPEAPQIVAFFEGAPFLSALQICFYMAPAQCEPSAYEFLRKLLLESQFPFTNEARFKIVMPLPELVNHEISLEQKALAIEYYPRILALMDEVLEKFPVADKIKYYRFYDRLYWGSLANSAESCSFKYIQDKPNVAAACKVFLQYLESKENFYAQTYPSEAYQFGDAPEILGMAWLKHLSRTLPEGESLLKSNPQNLGLRDQVERYRSLQKKILTQLGPAQIKDFLKLVNDYEYPGEDWERKAIVRSRVDFLLQDYPLLNYIDQNNLLEDLLQMPLAKFDAFDFFDVVGGSRDLNHFRLAFEKLLKQKYEGMTCVMKGRFISLADNLTYSSVMNTDDLADSKLAALKQVFPEMFARLGECAEIQNRVIREQTFTGNAPGAAGKSRLALLDRLVGPFAGDAKWFVDRLRVYIKNNMNNSNLVSAEDLTYFRQQYGL